MVLATCLGSFILVIFYFQSSLSSAEEQVTAAIWKGKPRRSPLQALYDSEQLGHKDTF